MINRQRFFNAIRLHIFGGSLTESQVYGIEAILDIWEALVKTTNQGSMNEPLSKLAYMLATTKWETDHTMRPISEIGYGRGRKYGKKDPLTNQIYYGRGFVQLTWKENYDKAGKKLGVDLVNNPDLAMKPEIAGKILFMGMQEGWFAGDKQGRHLLSRYFNSTVTDWIGARRIINGTDKAAKIAGIAQQFHTALLSSSVTAVAQVSSPPPVPKPVRKQTTTIAASITGAVIAVKDVFSPVANAVESGKSLGDAVTSFTTLPTATLIIVATIALSWIIRERIKARETYGR